ncbi:MAG: hypothetical protein AMXMBFR34_00210 [Myxococcaceae bacterium]
MSLALLAVSVLVVLALGYRLYGGFVARQYALDDSRQTPAERLKDGVDFVPTRPFYLLGQHFSAIAAAGPIAGPILAAKQFGWLPALVWISVGVWLKKQGKRCWYTLVPTALISAVTLTSLVLQAKETFAAKATVVQRVNGVVAVALLALAGQVLSLGVRALLRREQAPSAALA